MFTRYLKNYSSILNLISRVNSHLSSQRKKQFFLLSILMVSLSFAEAISLASIVPFIGVFLKPEIIYSYPWLNNFIEFFGITNNDDFFLLVTIIFLSFIIISFVIRLFFVYFSNKITFSTEADFRSKIFKYTINQSYSYHLKQSSNFIMSSLIQKTNSLTEVINGFIRILGSLLIIIFVLIILMLIEPFITLTISLFIIIFFVIVTFIKKKKIIEHSKEISRNQDRIVSIFQDAVGYIGEIILYSLQNIFISKFYKSSDQISKSHTYTSNVGESPRIYLEYIALISLTLLI